MDTKTLNTIKKVAKEVREKLVKEYNDEDLKGICLEASTAVFHELKHEGINSEIIEGTFFTDYPDYEIDGDEEVYHYPLHYWLKVEDIVVDITISQFQDECNEQLPKIFIGKAGDRYTGDNQLIPTKVERVKNEH